MNLFGFEIKRKKNTPDDKSGVVQVVVPENIEGTRDIVSHGPLGGHFVELYDSGVIDTDEYNLIKKYRSMSECTEIDKAISEIVNDAVTYEDNVPFPVKINLDKVELSESIKTKIAEEFNNILYLLKFNDAGYELFRNWYVDGRIYFHLIIDGKKVKDGIQKIIPIDSLYIKKIRNISRDSDGIITDIEVYYVYKPPLMTEATHMGSYNFAQLEKALKFTEESVTYGTSGLMDSERKMIISHLQKAIKPSNQLAMLEDSVVVYRVARAPERRIFYIDVGNLPKTKAEKYLNSIMNRYRNQIAYNTETGTIDESKRHMSMLEDFWLPRREGGRGTEIDTLQGGCFSMDTKVSLLDGRELSISDIENELNNNKKLYAYSCDPKTGKVTSGLISWAGVTHKSAKVMKVTLDNNESFICTYDHKFPQYNNDFVRIDDLDIGDSLIPLYRKQNVLYGNSDYEMVYCNGDRKWKYTHRIMAEGEGEVIHHKDFNRFNNSVDNLEYMTWIDHRVLYNKAGFSKEDQIKGSKAASQKLKQKEYEVEEYNHRIISIEYLDDPIEVGTITIDGDEIYHNHHTFALSCGVFTKNSSLGEMDDVAYFRHKLYESLNVPLGRLDNENSMFNLARDNEISREEIKFSKFINRLRNKFSRGVFSDIICKQLIMKNIITSDDWDNIESHIMYQWEEDSHFAELKKLAILKERIDVVESMDQMIERYYSLEYIRANILMQTEEEAKELEKQRDSEKDERDTTSAFDNIGQDIQAQQGAYGDYDDRNFGVEEEPAKKKEEKSAVQKNADYKKNSKGEN